MYRVFLFLAIFVFGMNILQEPTAAGWFGSTADLSFDNYYAVPNTKNWIIGIVGAIAAGVVIYFSAGTATPFIASIGTWIGNAVGLSGAAATSYGLALIGGGSLASGGLGMAGGIAILTVATTFTTQTAVPFALNYAQESFDQAAFHERTRLLPRFPMPRTENGPLAAKKAMAFLKERYDNTKAITDVGNRKAVEFALFELTERFPLKIDKIENLNERAASEAAQQFTLLALLHFHQGNDHKAKVNAEQALMLTTTGAAKVATDVRLAIAFQPEIWATAVRNGRSYGLPAAIWAVASLSDENVDVEMALAAFDTALGSEPQHQMAPFVASLFLDRLRERQDILTGSHLERAKQSIETRLTAPKVRAAAMLILMTQSLIVVKTRQDLVSDFQKAKFADREHRQKALARVTKAYDEQGATLAVLDGTIVSLLSGSEFVSDANNRQNLGQMLKLIAAYRDDRIRLNRIVETARGVK